MNSKINSYLPYLRSGKESETLLINQISLLRANNNQQVYKFGFGQSPFLVPKKISDALAQAAPRKEYMSVQGDLQLRKAIASFHKNMENRNFHKDQIIVGAGSKILIFSIMAAFEKAEVLLPAPSWVSYEPQAKLVGHNVDWIQTCFEDKWSLTPDTLEEYCNNRENPEIPLILVLNYPNNPTGQTFHSDQLKELASVMKKHSIIVIADEIYSLLKFEDRQASIADYYPEGCIVSSGLSKWCGAGGWRLGFIHIPKELGTELFQAVIGVASETYSCAPAPIQVAARTAYNDTDLANSFLSQQIFLLSQVNEYCTNALNTIGVNTHPCEGGFYLFPDFGDFKTQLNRNHIYTSKDLTCAIMDATGVALLPGTAFGMAPESLTVRLAFVDFDGSQILQDGTNPDFERVKSGINKLCQWLQNLEPC
ncbi:MAG: pyridoxal phosphate-dependent aminotransferase [Proteobacteria bacterium]|nr:pyridoxal phosphate-dependent aminotransferase [Pseudomonadota bacterium]